MKQSIYLEITRKGLHLEVSLSKGEQTLTHYEESPVSPEELGKRCNELMHLLNMVSRRGTIPSSVIEEMQQMGRVLYNEIFPLSIKSQLSECQPSDLVLRIDNTLVHVPWELLFDGEYFLCEKFNIGRMVKTQQIVAKRGQSSPSLPLRILIIADPRSDLKASYEEGKRIRDHIQNANLKVTLVTSEVSGDFLKKRLFNYDIIHYAGHADYDLENPNQSGWLLEDGKFTTMDIRRMGGCNPLPWMVFSNACQSGQTEEWQIDETGEEKIYGLANAFLLSGVQHYIGTFWKVLDEPSTHFALTFYDHVLNGASVGEAMRAARLVLREKYGEGNILWASYLLYGDPGLRYFPSDNAEEDKELAGVVSDSKYVKRHQDAYIQKNGLRSRSPSDNNGVYGWRYKEGTKKGLRFFNRLFLKGPLSVVVGVILAIFLVFGAIFYKTFITPNPLTTPKLTGINQHEGKIQGKMHDTIKLGEASDDQMAKYFQDLAKKYENEIKATKGDVDFWTSKPIAMFFLVRNMNDNNIKTQAEADILVHKMMSVLAQNPRMTILEREYLETLLKELDLGSSALADPEHNLRLGQIVAANILTTSSVSHFDGKWHVNLRIIASETSIIKASLSEIWDESEQLDSLDSIALRFAKKMLTEIERSFPLKGRINQYVSNNKVMLNIGYRHGVEKGMMFEVLKDVDILGVDGRPIASETAHVASVVITEVKDDFCYAEVKEYKENLLPGMKVLILTS